VLVRKRRGPYLGMLDLPGGSIEFGESPEKEDSELTIQLLKPEHESCTEDLQVFQWPEKSESVLDSSEKTESSVEAFQWDALEVISGDRCIPKPVHFAWKNMGASSESTVYDLLIAKDTAFEDPMVIKDISQPFRNVVNLQIGAQYFWKVIAKKSDSVLAVSAVRAFTTSPSTPRWLCVPGITNVRDMGGWRLSGNRHIRQGLIYRSSEMNGHVDITDEITST